MPLPKPAASLSVIDVAKAAGVGVGTVSRVINNHPSVSPATLESVRRAMALLGYSPPSPQHRRGYRSERAPTGRSIAQGRARTPVREVTLVMLTQYGLDWVLRRAPVFAAVLHGIQSMVEAHGGALVMRQASGWDQLLTAIQQSKGAPCLIMGEEPAGDPPAQMKFATAVWVMGSIRRFDGDHVQPDHFSLGQIAASHVIKNHHRHAAYLGVPISPHYHVSLRGSAFQMWLESADVKVSMLTHPEIIQSGPREHHANEDVLRELVARLVALPSCPTALLLQADILTPVIYRLLEESGLRPMRDIEVLTCNHEPAYLSHLKPQPVILDLHAEAIGRRAVEQVLWRFRHPHEPAMRVMVEPMILLPAA